MKKKNSINYDKVILVSTPWPLYTRPSIQLGALKAYISKYLPSVNVDAHHFYLALAEAIGYKQYHDICERTWLAESIYAALLYPERIKQIQKLFAREASRSSLLKPVSLKPLTTQIKKITDTFIEGIDWGTYSLAGFSVSLCQLTSALYFVKAIKQKHPGLITVVGGSTFAARTTQEVLDLFPEIDAVIIGEGELPLIRLIDHLKRSKAIDSLPAGDGIFTRYPTSLPKDSKKTFSQTDSLDSLPVPDYQDFFNLLGSFQPHQSFFPTLPVEISRGCWWMRTAGSKKSTGCAFCNLNLQWHGYRSKRPSHVVSEIDSLTSTYKTLSVAIADNVLPQDSSGETFKQLAALQKDLRLFSEIRATTPLKELRQMRDAGIQEVQVGIEALSTRLLRKLRKGTTAIQNLEIMRNCEALGVDSISNLICRFPGSDEQDVNETMQNLDFALPFRPLKIVNFWLGLDSPVWQNPENYGIKSVYNHPNWKYLFPARVYRALPFMIQAYRGNVAYQRKIWKPVTKKVKTWINIYNDLLTGPSHSPILGFRDGRDFLIIRQRRFQTEPMMHRLTGPSRQMYLFCQHYRSLKKICDQFPAYPEDKILAFLRMMVDKKLMFEENNKYLSLAVPIRF